MKKGIMVAAEMIANKRGFEQAEIMQEALKHFTFEELAEAVAAYNKANN